MRDHEEAGTGPSLKTSRRGFLKGVGLAAGATAVLPNLSFAEGESQATAGLKELGRGAREITLTVNGLPNKITVEPRTTLLEALRTKLDLTGSKEICDRGSCGGCTVLFDGKAVTGCMTLAIDAVGHEIVTAEGIGKDPKFAPLIEAFCEHDAAQCGYCIPGILVRSAALLKEIPSPTAEQVREGLAGNLCRCGTYSKIFDAVEACGRKGGLA
jgi:xanthine dehydrogenase YagT iron-sulfur-binding subunit